MDYINYELNKYYEQQEKAEKMAELGIESESEYAQYLEDLAIEAAEEKWEARRLEEY